MPYTSVVGTRWFEAISIVSARPSESPQMKLLKGQDRNLFCTWSWCARVVHIHVPLYCHMTLYAESVFNCLRVLQKYSNYLRGVSIVCWFGSNKEQTNSIQCYSIQTALRTWHTGISSYHLEAAPGSSHSLWMLLCRRMCISIRHVQAGSHNWADIP